MRKSFYNLARVGFIRKSGSPCQTFLRRSWSERVQDGNGRGSSRRTLPHIAELSVMPTQELSNLLKRTEKLDPDWTVNLTEHLKLLQPLPRPLVMHVLEKVRIMHESMPNVLDIRCGLLNGGDHSVGNPEGHGESQIYEQLTVVGDTHGQYWDLMNLFSEKVNNFPSASNPYIFNGDMVDRGLYSFEIIFSLLAIKLAAPKSVHILRGNHETTDMNSIYGFERQVLGVYDADVLEATRNVFRALPIAATINKKIFIVHGGIGKETCSMTIEDINTLNRFVDSPSFRGPLSELLWSDPSDKISGVSLNKQRGAGWIFGENATKNFLRLNDLDMLVRSHECRQ